LYKFKINLTIKVAQLKHDPKPDAKRKEHYQNFTIRPRPECTAKNLRPAATPSIFAMRS
jgi:hypothetical protein